MKHSDFSFGRMMVITSVAAVIAVLASLAYLGAEPGPMHLGEILAAVFGVGIAVIVAGALASLMFLSHASGRDDAAGGGSDRDS